jgi:chitinase
MLPLSFSSLFSIVCLWLVYLQCSGAAEINEAIAPNQEPGQSPNIFKLLRRDTPSTPDYSCDTDRPCTDSSCCNIVTKSCGRDPTHCAVNVCISNCDAKAECGIGAADPSASCPLNVCCSKFGYCGVGEDFCGDGCQSNCGQPLAINSGVGDVQKLVIGYWEGWCLTSRSCSARTINDVPIDSLTHLNLAFAYITSDFDITPMPGIGEDVYSQILSLKARAPGLKIWISIGGWTFNDNDTSTQPLFSEISSTETNRGIFATNLFTFCKTWGFDGKHWRFSMAHTSSNTFPGVDLDWEYPGAGDRGGTPADTPNFTKLLEQISAVFASASLGLSFTAPTSYWYLQHFDIGQMYQYVNWINLMTYDL